MKVSNIDKLMLSKAGALKTVYGYCVQYDLEITLSKEHLKIVLPCGAELSAIFDPIGDMLSAESLLYKQLKAVKRLLRELKEVNEVKGYEFLKESYQRDDYLKESV